MTEPLSVVICALNSQYIHSSLAPWYLLAGIETYCTGDIKAQVIEATINEELEAVVERILAQNPQVIGFSCYIWNIEVIKKIVALVKQELADAVIILGGPEVSYNVANTLRENPLVQYVVSGEGEKALAQLLNAICYGESVTDIPGVSYREGEELLVAEPYYDWEAPPSPYTKAYFQALQGRIAYLETSRGCPYFCAFCLSGYGNVRYFDLERGKRELISLANSGTRTIKFVDRTFNSNRARALELFSFVIDNYGSAIPEGVCCHFEIAGDILDNQTLDLLAKAPAGSIQFEIGIQSFNADTLTAIRRRTNVELLESNLRRLINKGNIHIHIDLIAGLPYEDLESFATSFNKAYELRPHMLQLGFLKVLYGSQIHADPEKYPCSYEPLAPYEVTETPWLSAEDLAYLHRLEDALKRLYNSGRFRRTLDYLLESTELTPFKLFGDFAEHIKETEIRGIPLEDYIGLVYEYFATQSQIDKKKLRDKLVCDYLATNSTGRLPRILQIKDPAYKVLKRLKQEGKVGNPEQKGMRGIALLYSEAVVVWADYQAKDPVTGEYPLKKCTKESLDLV